MMEMGIKFFDGPLSKIEQKFNERAKGKYTRETTLHPRKQGEACILKVVYGKREVPLRKGRSFYGF